MLRSTSARVRMVLSWLALALVGCSNGPDEAALRGIVAASLERDLQAGLFSVEDFRRRGSYAFDDDGPRLRIYFKTDLAFLEAYDLSGWDSLGTGSLVSVLGATPGGVSGVSSDGNAAGDLLTAYGSVVFKDEGGTWVPVPGASDGQETGGNDAGAPTARLTYEEDAAEVEYWDKELPWHKQYIQGLNAVVSEFAKRKERKNISRLRLELDAVLYAADLRAGVDRGWSTIATGGPTGEYYALGRGLEAAFEGQPATVKAYVSEGSVRNAELLGQGGTSFGIVQSDVAAMARAGRGPFEETGPVGPIRAVGALFPEAMHVVVRGDSQLFALSDLVGKVVNTGPPGSGVRYTALEVLTAAEIPVFELGRADEQPIHTAADALARGEIDAFFLTSGYPARVVQELASHTAIRLLPVDGQARATLVDSGELIGLTLARNTYRGMDAAVETVGITAVLATHGDVDDASVVNLLKVVFEQSESLSRFTSQAGALSLERARSGVTIPFHPAADAYLKSTGH